MNRTPIELIALHRAELEAEAARRRLAEAARAAACPSSRRRLPHALRLPKLGRRAATPA